MKLRNKKTGEIIDLTEGFIKDTYNGSMIQIKPVAISNKEGYVYGSLTELNAEWEDYEEPKECWHIDFDGSLMQTSDIKCDKYVFDKLKEIGNYFETREEAEKAVEKLKAIQRLKSHYIKFKLDFVKNKIDFTYRIDGTLHSSVDEERIIFEDLDLLFGGEE